MHPGRPHDNLALLPSLQGGQLELVPLPGQPLAPHSPADPLREADILDAVLD